MEKCTPCATYKKFQLQRTAVLSKTCNKTSSHIKNIEQLYNPVLDVLPQKTVRNLFPSKCNTMQIDKKQASLSRIKSTVENKKKIAFHFNLTLVHHKSVQHHQIEINTSFLTHSRKARAIPKLHINMVRRRGKI